MNQAIISRPPTAPVQIPMPIPARRKYHVPEPTVKFPPREKGGPVHISTLLDPILEISSHPTGTGCWRSSSTDRKNTVIHTLIHIIMFFTAINQMMTEGVDLTLVIRKANGQMAVSVLPKSNGLKDEAQNHIIPLTLKGVPQELDTGFLQAVARPVQKATGLITNMAQFEAQTEKPLPRARRRRMQRPRRRKRRKRNGRSTRSISRKLRN